MKLKSLTWMGDMFSLENALRVEINNDYDLVAEFIQWQLETKTFSYRGAVSGRGHSLEYFPEEHAEAVRSFFEGREQGEVDDNF